MSNLSISLNDYNGGPGEMSMGELDELQKALEAGSITGRSTAGLENASGAPLKVESLENSLKILTFKESDIQFWKMIPKLPAYNTVEEYNELKEYGGDLGGFNNEGEAPQEESSIYVRRSQLVKFMGELRSVSHPMQLVNTMIGNVIQQEIKNGTMSLLRKADRALFFGDEGIVTQEFNGILTQQKYSFAPTQTVAELDAWDAFAGNIDLRGKALKEAAVEQASLSIIENFGSADLLMAPPQVLSIFATTFHESKLIQPNTPANMDAIVGQRNKQFMSQWGPITLGYDKFMKHGVAKTLSSVAIGGALAPTIPVADVTTPKAATIEAGAYKFLTDEAGDYYYAVSAFNRYGESTLVDLSLAIAPLALLSIPTGYAANLKFAAGAGGTAAAGFIIYRSKKDPATTMDLTSLYPIIWISLAQRTSGFDGGGGSVIRDKNRTIAGTDIAFVAQVDLEVMAFKQLAPLMKMDLAVLAPATRFMLLLYGTPQLYAPKKIAIIRNIGLDLT